MNTLTCVIRVVRHAAFGALLVASLVDVRLGAQAPKPSAPSFVDAASTRGEPATLRFNNRPITVLRATILGRTPAERAAVAVQILDGLVDSGSPGTVSTRPFQGVTIITVGNRDVFAITPLDVDELVGETLDQKATETATRLQQALDEAIELRTPRRLLTSASLALVATIAFGLLLWVARRVHRALVIRVLTNAEKKLEQLSPGHVELVSASHASDLLRRGITLAFLGLVLFVTYNWLTFVLRRFPDTRPWGESLRAYLTSGLAAFGLKIVEAIPDLVTVAIIIVITRFVIRICHQFFRAVEDGRVTVPWVYPETAAPTRRLVNGVLWLLALIASYPYLPGSESDAFKGVSVFVGLVLSLGSSGIVNQMMSGLTITYSRAVRPGDFVRIGDVEGTVLFLGALSTKVKTPRGEEVTIPNNVVVSNVTTNYSKLAVTEGVYVPTSITIGYDAPWRQVHALLHLAAERTPGILSEPKPAVRQTALQDFYVQYTLLVCLEQPQLRASTLSVLHANIQDAFNEYGVQIMSPNYEADPSDRKVVPRDQWYAAPATTPPSSIETL
jgi:small-conductance mechanosensitive channel